MNLAAFNWSLKRNPYYFSFIKMYNTGLMMLVVQGSYLCSHSGTFVGKCTNPSMFSSPVISGRLEATSVISNVVEYVDHRDLTGAGTPHKPAQTRRRADRRCNTMTQEKTEENMMLWGGGEGRGGVHVWCNVLTNINQVAMFEEESTFGSTFPLPQKILWENISGIKIKKNK